MLHGHRIGPIHKQVFYSSENNFGYRTIADSRQVNFGDKFIFIDYLIDKLGALTDAYKDQCFDKIIFTYIIKDGVAEDPRLLTQSSTNDTSYHTYNNLFLPLTMDPAKFGSVTMSMGEGKIKKYLVQNGSKSFVLDVATDGTTNKVHLLGAANIKWTDTKISEDTFKREIGKNIFYIRGGEIIVKSKELNAKPFSKSNHQ